MHQFLTGREAGGIKPVFGLTAYVLASSPFANLTCYDLFSCCHRGILIRVATIGYAREPDFEVQPPNASTTEERIAWALLNRDVFRIPCEKEGIDLRPARRLLEAREKKEREREKRKRKGEVESKL